MSDERIYAINRAAGTSISGPPSMAAELTKANGWEIVTEQELKSYRGED